KMKVLVLCIDRDDDLGQKAGIKGPIIGEDKNKEAATALIMADPTESDANAMFEALKVLRELKKEGAGIATLTGHPTRGYLADKTIAHQLDMVLEKYKKIDGVFLVTDGADDDEIIPIIHSRTKILSKRTLIIKQAKELEKSYYVIKQVLKDPTFARVVFGLPGLVLLMVAFLQDFGIKMLLLAVGFYLMLKGFGFEDPIFNSIRGFRETTSIQRASFPLYLGTALMFLLALMAGVEKLTAAAEPNIIKQVAVFAMAFMPLFVISAVLFFIGRIGDMHYRKETHKISKYAMSIVSIVALWIVLTKAAELMLGSILLDVFLLWLFGTFLGSIVGFSVIRKIYSRKYISSKLSKGLEIFDADGDWVGVVGEVNRKRKHIIAESASERGGKEEKTRIIIPFSQIIAVKDYVAVRKIEKTEAA
ncbi:MAG: DUF373 family protein, partial [Candidatus Micrarchaeota archaeon]